MNRNNGRIIAVRLLSLRDYLYANADKKHAVRVDDIQKHYENMGFENASIKTVYSDLHALQSDEFNIDIAYDEKAKGWLLFNPPFEPYEMRLIVDSIQASKFITQTEAKRLTKKITDKYGSGRRQNLNRQAYVFDRVRSLNDSVVKETDHIHEAIAANRKISFRYFHYSPDRRNSKTYTKSGERVIVSPFALYWNNGNLYLYAYDGKMFRFYRVDRMESISKPLREIREGHDLFNVKDLTRKQAKVFDMFSTGKSYDVKFRCHNRIAHAVIDQFGKDIMMMADGAVHFTFTQPVEISPPFFAWVATFGRSIQIVNPAPVVEEMRLFLQKSMDMYKNDGNT